VITYDDKTTLAGSSLQDLVVLPGYPADKMQPAIRMVVTSL